MAHVISGGVGAAAVAASPAAGKGATPSGGNWLLSAAHAATDGSFAVFFALSKMPPARSWRTYLAIVVQAAQIMAFSLSSQVFSWPASARPAQIVTAVTTSHGYVPWASAALFQTFHFIALSFSLLTIVLFVAAVYGAARSGRASPSSASLKMLATVGTAASTWLYIPLMYLLLGGFTCHDPRMRDAVWLPSGVTACYQGAHLAQTLIFLFVAMATAGIAVLFTLLAVDTHPLSTAMNARAHARVDAVLLLFKTLLVVIAQVVPGNVGVAALVAVLVIAAVVWLTLHIAALPYLHHGINRLVAALAAINLWVTLCLVLDTALDEYDGGIMVYAGVPIAALTGLFIADWRSFHIFTTSLARLDSSYAVELKIRYFLHDALYGHPTQEVLRNRDGSGSGSSPSLVAAAKDGGSSGASATAAAEGDSSRVGSLEDLDGADDNEARVTQVRALISKATLKEAEALLKAAISHFKGSPMLSIVAARFYYVWCANSHLAMSHCSRAERLKPSLDVSYFVFAQQKVVDETTGGKASISALSRLAFEQHLTQARQHTRRALQSQAAFWAELSQVKPDLTRCHGLAGDMTQSVAAAENAFRELMSINSQSLLVLRLYSSFTLYVANNLEKANVLIAEAERLEDQEARDYAKEGSVVRMFEDCALDVLADNTAAVTLGGSPHNLGIILTVSPYATKLFGHPRYAMERRNIMMLMPEPISSLHDGFLHHFSETGEGIVVGYTRVVFGLHRSGYIFPVVLYVREQPASRTGAGSSFLGIMRSISTPEQHILMRSDFTVTAASQASLSLLNVEAAGLAAGDARMQDWVIEWDIMLEEMKSGTTRGVPLCIVSSQARERASERAAAAAAAADRGRYRGRRQSGPGGASATAAASRFSVGAGVSTASLMRGGGAAPNTIVTPADAVWIRVHLQEVPLPGGASMAVLYWVRMTDENAAITYAAEQRREALAAIGLTVVDAEPKEGAGAGAGAGAGIGLSDARRGSTSGGATSAALTVAVRGGAGGHRASGSAGAGTPRRGAADKAAPQQSADSPRSDEAARSDDGGDEDDDRSEAREASDRTFSSAQALDTEGVEAMSERGRHYRAGVAAERQRSGRNLIGSTTSGRGALPAGHPPVPAGATQAGCPAVVKIGVLVPEGSRDGRGSVVSAAAGSIVTASTIASPSSRAGVAPGFGSRPPLAPASMRGVGAPLSPTTVGGSAGAASGTMPRSAMKGRNSALAVATSGDSDPHGRAPAGTPLAAAPAAALSPTSGTRKFVVLRSHHDDDEGASSRDAPPATSGGGSSGGTARSDDSTRHIRERASLVSPTATGGLDRPTLSPSPQPVGGDGSGGGDGASGTRRRSVQAAVNSPVWFTQLGAGGDPIGTSIADPRSGGPRAGWSEAGAGGPHDGAGFAAATSPVAGTSATTNPMAAAPSSAAGGGGAGALTIVTPAAAASDPRERGVIIAAPPGGQDRGSYSSSRRSTARRLQERLRRALADTHQSLLPSLKWLSLAGTLFSIVIIGLAIFLVSFLTTEFTQYTALLAAVAGARDLAIDATLSTVATRNLLAANVTARPPLRTTLSALAARMEDTHLKLYALATAVGRASTYTTDNIALQDVYHVNDSVPSVDNVRVTLLAAGLRMVSHVEAIAALPDAALSATHPSVMFVLANGGAALPMQTALNATLFVWHDANDAMSEDVSMTLLAIFLAIVLTVAILTLGFIVPILINIDRTRDAFVLPFVQLPVVVPTKLRAQAERRIRLLDASDAEADEEAAGGDADNDDDARLDEVGGGVDDGDGEEGDVEEGRRKRRNAADAYEDDEGDLDNLDWAAIMQAHSGGTTKIAGAGASAGAGSTAGAVTTSGSATGTGASAGGIIMRSGGGGGRGSASDHSLAPYSAGPSQVQFTANSAHQAGGAYTPVAAGGRGGGGAVINDGGSAFSGDSGSVGGARRRGGPITVLRSRAYHKSSRSLLKLLLRFLLPMLAVLLAFAVVYGVCVTTLAQVLLVQDAELVGSLRAMASLEVPAALQPMVSAPAASTTASTLVTRASARIDDLDYQHRLLTFGDSGSVRFPGAVRASAGNWGMLTTSQNDAIKQAMLGNACGYGAGLAIPGYNASACAAFRGGALTRGLNNAMVDMLALARYAVSRKASSLSNASFAYGYDAELNSVEVASVITYANAYLLPMFRALAIVFNAAVAERIVLLRTFVVAIVTTFIIGFALYQVFVFAPKIYQTNAEIKEERVMVLLLPSSVIQAVPQLQALVATWMDDNAGSSSGSVGGGSRNY